MYRRGAASSLLLFVSTWATLAAESDMFKRVISRRVVADQWPSPGDILDSNNSIIITLDDNSVIYSDLKIPEIFAPIIKKGLPITAKFSGNKNKIYNGTVYAVQVFKQSSPIKIGKILISEYRYDDKEIKWEGQNASKSIKYYAIVDRLSHVLNIKYVFVSGSKSKNNSEKFFYCKFTNWQTIEEFLKPQLEN